MTKDRSRRPLAQDDQAVWMYSFARVKNGSFIFHVHVFLRAFRALYCLGGRNTLEQNVDATLLGRAAKPFARAFAHSDRSGVEPITHVLTCSACVVLFRRSSIYSNIETKQITKVPSQAWKTVESAKNNQRLWQQSTIKRNENPFEMTQPRIVFHLE